MFKWKDQEREIAAAVHARTAGNPLWIVQLIETLVDDNRIRRRDGLWSIEPEQIERIQPPKMLVNDIVKRLSNLSQDELSLFSIASVLGGGFEIECLKEISGMDHEGFSKHWDNILSERILWQSVQPRVKDLFHFVNGFTRDFIYQQIDLQERIKLHQKVGNFLEGKYASEPKDHFDQFAEHFYQAEDKDRALRYLLSAAQESEKVVKAGGLSGSIYALLSFTTNALFHRSSPSRKSLKHWHSNMKQKATIPEALNIIKTPWNL